MIRPDGVAGIAFGTLRDGDARNDDGARTIASESLGIPSEWAWARQVHGAVVMVPRGPGIGAEADALITTDPALPVAVSVADCLPVALLSEGAVGMVHAGWRGVATGVVPAAVEALTERGHPPHTAVIGPGIGPCCFEVGAAVSARFPEHQARTSWGTLSVDLPGAVVASLSGLEVQIVPGCTHHEDDFHSYRGNGTNQRQFGVAWVAAA